MGAQKLGRLLRTTRQVFCLTNKLWKKYLSNWAAILKSNEVPPAKIVLLLVWVDKSHGIFDQSHGHTSKAINFNQLLGYRSKGSRYKFLDNPFIKKNCVLIHRHVGLSFVWTACISSYFNKDLQTQPIFFGHFCEGWQFHSVEYFGHMWRNWHWEKIQPGDVLNAGDQFAGENGCIFPKFRGEYSKKPLKTPFAEVNK